MVASVLLSAEEERRLKRLARGRAPGPVLLRLAQRDIDANGLTPAVIAPGPVQSVARKLSVSVPYEQIEGLDARRGTASYGAYLRSLLEVPRDGREVVPASLRVACRAARPLPAGTLNELALGETVTDLVEFVPDVDELGERWAEGAWQGMSLGETGWLLLGLLEVGGPSTLKDRRAGEEAFGALRGHFRGDASIAARVVLQPSFVFRRYVRGRRLGEARWVECAEDESDGVVVVVRVETLPLRAP